MAADGTSRIIIVKRGGKMMRMTFDTAKDSLLGTAIIDGTRARIYVHQTCSGESHYYGHVTRGSEGNPIEHVRREKALEALMGDGSDLTEAGAALFVDIEEV